LEQIDRNDCYCDTDSLIYIEDENTRQIVDNFIGDGLGEWTNELNENFMIYFCCAQPKDYGYILDDGREVGKVKGFSANAEAEQKMTNKERIKLIKGAIDNVCINYNQFTIEHGKITTKPMVKHWAFKFDKRMIKISSDDEIDTLPYGY
jgi:hypothetical protein